MKWKNRGHEFDVLGESVRKLSAVYLFGAGVLGQAVYKMYYDKLNIKGFIDNDIRKQGGLCCGLLIYGICDIELEANEAIVITTQSAHAGIVTRQLEDLGIIENVYYIHTFFPVFDYYRNDEICIPSISFLPSTVCNLRCKHCLNFTTYIKNHRIRPIEQLKENIDLLFSKIDTIILFHISGGEPLVYPYLAELIEYVDYCYGKKIGRIEITTNGSVIPEINVVKKLYTANVHVIVDDYRNALSQEYSEKYSQLIDLFEKYMIDYSALKASSWIDLAPFDTKHTNLSEKWLCEHFNTCDVQRQEYREGKLYLCNYSSYADFAGIQPAQRNEYIDLNGVNNDNRGELLEFRLGYSEKGYTEFCKRCAGFHNNPNSVDVGEQV